MFYTTTRNKIAIKLTKLKIQMLKLKYLEDINQLIKSDTAEENHQNMFL